MSLSLGTSSIIQGGKFINEVVSFTVVDEDFNTKLDDFIRREN